MRFNKPENAVDKTNWHQWFAWRPVVAEDGTFVWLEYVWRKLDYGTYDTFAYYRAFDLQR